MTPEERMERIENGWLELQRGHKELQQGHRELQQSMKLTNEAIASLAATVDRYVSASDERMKRIEANLDALIRAITAEHSNGKGKPGGN